MSKDVNREISLKIDADLAFDRATFPLDAIEVKNPTSSLYGGAEEEGFQSPFEASSDLTFLMGRHQIAVDLAGSGAATEALWSSVGGE